MMKYRIIYNGEKYRVQKKVFFKWMNIEESCGGPTPILIPIEFHNKEKAKEFLINKYTIKPNILERKWEKAGWEWV